MASKESVFAGIAQSVEQRIRNAWVVGSIPIPGSTLKTQRKPQFPIDVSGVLLVRALTR
jgi:hypothetical protein